MQTRISLDFNVDGITKVIQETNKLEKRFEAVGDKITSQSNKVKNLVSSVKELNALLGGKSELGGNGNVETFSESVQTSLRQAIEMAQQLQTALNNLNVPAEITGGLNTIVKTGNKVLNTSPTSYSSSDIKSLKEISNLKPAKIDTANIDDVKAALSEVQKLEAEYSKLSGGKDIKTPKIDSKTINTVIQYANALSKLEGVMTYIADGFAGKTLATQYENAAAVLGPQLKGNDNEKIRHENEKIVTAFEKTYAPKGDTGYLKQWQKEFTKNNKELLSRTESSAQQATQKAAKATEEQVANTAPIKVTVDKDALVNDITTAIQSKEYTINVKPQQNIADDISKQLEGRVANINVVAGASNGVASVNSQISDFQSAYDKYVGIVNSGKGSTASLLKQYPLLSDYQKGMDIDKTKSELTGKFANQITAGSSKEISVLTDNLNKLTNAAANSEGLKESLASIGDSIKAIVPSDIDIKVLSLVEALEFLKSSLAGLKIEDTPFIQSINNLLSQGDALKDLATIMANSNQITATDKAVSNKKGTDKISKADVNWAYRNQEALGYEDYKELEDVVIKQAELQGKKIEDKSQVQNTIASVFSRSGIDYVSKATKDIDKTSVAMNNLQVGTTQSKEAFNNAKEAVEAYSNALKEMLNEQTKDTVTNAVLTQIQAKDAVNAYTGMKDQYAKTTQVNKIRDSVSKDINQNSKMDRDIAERYRLMQGAMEAYKDLPVTTEKYNEMQSIYSNLRAEMQATGQVGNSLFTKLQTGLGARIVQFTSFYLSFYRVVQYIRQGIDTLKQFDTTLTKISYTMNISDKALSEMGKSMQNIASDLSAPLENVEKIYTVYANMKTNPKEVEEMTKYTTVLSNLAGIDASAAADDVQGVIQQFDLASEDTAHIVDAFDYISANIAVDYSKGIEGLAEAVQGSGNVAQMAGLSFEQYGSIIAKTMEQTRMDGSRISNALRTIMTRLSKASSMDDSVTNATLSQASKALNEIGIQVYTTAGEYREFDTIMTELAAKWDGLTDSQRENISFAIAATRQTAMLKSVLNNWTDSMDLATEATNNNGSALKNNEKWEKSLAGRMTKIKTQMQNFAVNFFDDGSVDNTIGLLITLTKVLEKLGGTFGTVALAATTMASVSAFRRNGQLNPMLRFNPNPEMGLKENITNRASWGVNTPFGTVFATKKYNAQLEKDVAKWYGYKKAGDADSAASALADYNRETQLKADALYEGGHNIDFITGKLKQASVASRLFSKGINLVGSALSGLAVGAVMWAITSLIEGMINASKEAEELKDNVKSFNDENKQTNNTRQSNIRQLKSYDDTFNALSAGVDEKGNNVSLLTEEFNKYNNIANEVAELMPNLVAGWTEEGNAIIRLTDNYKTLSGAYQDYLNKEDSKEYDSKDFKENVGTVLDNWNKNIVDPEGDIVGYDVTQWMREWIPGFTILEGILTGNGDEILGGPKYAPQIDISKPTVIDQLGEALQLTDEKAKEYLKEHSDLGEDRYTTDGEFDREKAQNLLVAEKADLDSAREARKSLASKYLATLSGSYDAGTIQYAQEMIALGNGAYFDEATTQEEYEKLARDFIKQISNLTDNEREAIKGLLVAPTATLANVNEYLQSADKYAKTLGLGGASQEFADQYGFGEAYAFASDFKNFYTQKRKNKDQKILDQILGMTNIGTQEELNDLQAKINSSGYQGALDYYLYQRSKNAKEFDFEKSWANMDNVEAYQKTKQGLLELANQGKLTIDTFKNVEGADQWIKDMGIVAEDVIPKINQLAGSAKQLGALADNVESLRTAYGEKRDEGIVSANTLSSMTDTFGKLDYWSKYEQVVGTKSSTLSEVKAASDKLLTEYVNTGDYLAKLSDSNKQMYIDQLSDMGVANASEVVNSKLKEQKDILKDIGAALDNGKNDKILKDLGSGADDLTTSFTTLQSTTGNEAFALMQLSGAAQLTKAYLADLALTRIDWDSLNANEAISKLYKIAKAAGITTDTIKELSDAEHYSSLIKNLEAEMSVARSEMKNVGKNDPATNTYYSNILNNGEARLKQLNQSAKKYIGKSKNNVQSKVKDKFNNLNNLDFNMSTKGIDSKNGKDKSDSTKDTKQQFDWLERRITVITSKIDLLKSKLENLFSMKKKQSNLSKQIKEQTRLLKTYNKQVDTYGNKAAAVGLSSKLKKKIRNGQLKGTKAQLIQKYGEDTANKIEEYQDWYDKKQTAKKNRQEAIAARRQLKIDKQQLYVDKYNAQAEYKDLASTSGFKTYKERNALLNQEAKAIKKSYAHQIRIAEIQHDYVKVEQLKLERENKLVELQKKQFDNVITYYDRLVSTVSHFTSVIEGQIAVAEAKGANADVVRFREAAANHREEGKLNAEEYKAAEAQLGNIKKGTSEWYDALDKLRDLEIKKYEIEKSVVEQMNKVREAYEKLFDVTRDQIRRVHSEQSFGRDLLSNYSLFDYDTGIVSDHGKAYSSSLVKSIYDLRKSADRDKAELDKLMSYRSGDTGVTKVGQDEGYQSRKVLDERIDKVYNDWQEDLKDISGLQSDIFKFVEDSLKKEEDLLKKLIDKRKEELDAAKDLHDYQKSIQEKTKSINDIQRQISAYRGDTSQEGMSKLQQLQQQLLEAQDDLQETEYDKYISDQKQMLDNLYQDYQDRLEELLSDFKNVVKSGFDEIAKYFIEGNKLFADILNQEYGYQMQYTEDGSYSGIQKQVDNIVNHQTALSGTQNDKTNVSPTKTAEQLKKEETDRYWASKGYTKATKAQVDSVFQDHTYKAKKGAKKTDFKSAINQYLFEHNDKKVLSNKGLEMLRFWLKLSDNGQIIEALNYLKGKFGNIKHVKGFAKGGMVGDVVRRNGDDGFATLKVGEAVLTPVEAQQFKKLVTALPSLNNLTSELNSIKDREIGLQSSNTFGDTYIDINLPNVENSTDFLNAIKNDDKIQKALQDVTINRLNGGSRLGVKKIR